MLLTAGRLLAQRLVLLGVPPGARGRVSLVNKRGASKEAVHESKRRQVVEESADKRGASKQTPVEVEVKRSRREEPDQSMLIGQLMKIMEEVDLTEIYSPPRVTKEAIKFKLQPGEAFDLTTGWNFNKRADRIAAEAYMDSKKPLLVIGSPLCTMFSTLQNLTAWSKEK